MPLPPRPPTPLIQMEHQTIVPTAFNDAYHGCSSTATDDEEDVTVSSPVPSEVRFKSPACTHRPPAPSPASNEFDPTLLREYILRDAILRHQLRIEELSIICGEARKNSAGKKSGISLSIEIPSPITRSVFGIPSPPPAETEPIGFHFFMIALGTLFVFMLMTYIYVKGFVSSH